MDEGWDAREFLRDLLKERKSAGMPHTQQWLSEQTGIQRGTINGYMADKASDKTKPRLQLGMKNAPRIAQALDVTVQELGGPDGQDLTVTDHLEELATGIQVLIDGQGALLRHFGLPVPVRATRGAHQ